MSKLRSPCFFSPLAIPNLLISKLNQVSKSFSKIAGQSEVHKLIAKGTRRAWLVLADLLRGKLMNMPAYEALSGSSISLSLKVFFKS